MKKTISLALALIIAAGCISLSACGSDTDEVEEEAVKEEEEEAPSGGSLTWNDIPVYSGAKQAQKGSWAIPAEQGEWSKVEWRYYETGDSAEEVASFYKSRMPGQGWQEMMWMEAEGVAWAYYSKNNEADGAMFWCASEEGETVFALMRATQ